MFHRFALLLFTVLAGTSCVSLRSNYLGRREGLHLTAECLILKPDSLLQVLGKGGETKRPFSAREMNQINTLFGQQLQQDRIPGEVLWGKYQDSTLLKMLPYEATARLLASAEQYQCLYQRIPAIRRALNRGDSGNDIPKRSLQKSRNFLLAPSIRRQASRLREQYPSANADSLMATVRSTNWWKALKNRLFRDKDRWNAAYYSFVRRTSHVFGSVVGKMQGRNYAQQNADLLVGQVQPFDIVLMKSPQRLTDHFIPGYFGHVALCLGTDSMYIHRLAPKQDFREFYPKFPHTAMAEAVRKEGVRISRLEEFAEGKVFLVMRPNALSDARKEEVMTNIFKQLKKKYDFQFDLNSLDAITCTELIFIAYDDVNWKLEQIMGRFTLSPDGIFEALKDNGQFRVPVILDHGKMISNPSWSEIDSLMKE